MPNPEKPASSPEQNLIEKYPYAFDYQTVLSAAEARGTGVIQAYIPHPESIYGEVTIQVGKAAEPINTRLKVFLKDGPAQSEKVTAMPTDTPLFLSREGMRYLGLQKKHQLKKSGTAWVITHHKKATRSALESSNIIPIDGAQSRHR